MFQPLATPSPFCYIYFFFYNEIYACKLVTNCHEVTLSLFSGDRNFPSAVASPIMTCVVAPVTELSAHTLHPHPARVYRFFGSKNRDLQRYQQIIFQAFLFYSLPSVRVRLTEVIACSTRVSLRSIQTINVIVNIRHFIDNIRDIS